MLKKRENAPARIFLAEGANDCACSPESDSARRDLLGSSSVLAALSGDSILRNRPFLSGFGAMLFALLPFQAFAQTSNPQTVAQPDQPMAVRDRPHPEYDPLGMRLGSFKLNATLGLDVSSTDNLFAAPSGEAVDDLVFGEEPYVRLASDWSRNALELDAGGRFTQHRDFSGQDSTTGFIHGAGRFDIGTSTSINASAGTAHLVSPRTDPDDPHTGAPVEYDTSNALLGIEQRFVNFRLNADVSGVDYSYDGDQNFRDNKRTAAHGRVTYDLSPRIGLFADAVIDHRDYDNSPTLTSDGQTYLAGARFTGDLFRGELAAGYFQRKFDGTALGSFDGLAVEGSLDWFVTEITTVSIDARRDANAEVSTTVGLPYITNEVGIHVDHELLRNVILSAEYRRGEREYDTIDRDDNYSQINVGADYILNRRVAIQLRLEHFEEDSSGTNAYFDYNVNTATIGLSLRL
jgi:hypothetical protein